MSPHDRRLHTNGDVAVAKHPSSNPTNRNPHTTRPHNHDDQGDKVKTTEHTASPASTPKTGIFATLRGLPRAQGSGTPATGRVRVTLAAIAAALATGAALGAILPAAAGAFATAAPPPVFSTAPGLPDNRVYEQVSPADKSGNEAGASTSHVLIREGRNEAYAVAAGDGNSALFTGTGPFGETASPLTLFFVAQRTASGWKTRSVMPSQQETAAEFGGILNSVPVYLYPSADLSHAMFQPERGRFAGLETTCAQLHFSVRPELYLAGSDPFVPATWLDQPEIPNPIKVCREFGEAGAPVGGSPDLSTAYFTVPGTLLPEDASRAPNAGERIVGGSYFYQAWGFYEYREGALHEAGVLPNGRLDPFGAVPAASGHARSRIGNQVSSDGSRAFFVSPDPASCTYNGGTNDCVADPPQLYVRENGAKTVLVSQSQLPGKMGEPAPDGTFRMSSGSYVFASPDGSQAFFQSVDKLTSDAPEGPPGNTSPKTYAFDLNTGTLTYLPGVSGQILATDTDGSSMAFLDSSVSPAQLDLWSAGPGGGSVTPITQLPDGGGVEPARMSSDGSVVVFMATGLPGFNDAGSSEIFRYEVAGNTLSCVSCAPTGVASGFTSMSQMINQEITQPSFDPGVVDERGISSDGSRVFFQTSAALTPQDTNTRPPTNYEGESVQNDFDVYEWENGVIYLISPGKGLQNSYFLDNSENGDDMFFATTQGLAPGDTDGAYDVYDARVPHAGDNPPPAAVPCQGSVCQGPPNVPAPLGAPASATFSGLGNPVGGGESNPSAAPAVKPKPTPKATKCRRSFVKQKGKCVKKQRTKRSKRGRK
jgi:hypothetical protein